jgi:Raf kinase inhibitor-like YbhB/YbcL family protein
MQVCQGQDDVTEEAQMSFELTSLAFREGQPIPSIYTCDGKDISPPLAWADPPQGTKSFALINDDPDAPGKTWVHWVVYNIPPSARQLPEAFPSDRELSDGTLQGMTDSGRVGYGGPCPPSGTHRYFFKLYALNAVLSLPPGASKAQLEQAMQSATVARTQLMGTYRRRGR